MHNGHCLSNVKSNNVMYDCGGLYIMCFEQILNETELFLRIQQRIPLTPFAWISYYETLKACEYYYNKYTILYLYSYGELRFCLTVSQQNVIQTSCFFMQCERTPQTICSVPRTSFKKRYILESFPIAFYIKGITMVPIKF